LGGILRPNNTTDKTTRAAARWLQVDRLSIDWTRIRGSVALLGGMLRMRTLPAGSIAPCLPTKADTLHSGGLWVHEIKHDDFRIIARKIGPQVRLYSRLGAEEDWARERWR
jgi:hypothetical protein